MAVTRAPRGRPRRLPRRHDLPPAQPARARRSDLEAMICWIDEPRRCAPGDRLRAQADDPHRRGRRSRTLRYRLDVDTPAPRHRRRRRSSSTTSAASRCARPRRWSSTSTGATARPGSFILVDEATNDTVGRGHDRRRSASGRRAHPHRERQRRLARRARSRATSAGARSARAARRSGSPACRLGQVDDRRRARARAGRRPAARLPARRRQPAPRPERRPRLHAADRAENVRRVGEVGAADRRRRRWSRSCSWSRPYARRPRPRARELHEAAGAAVRRGLRGHAARGVRAARPEGPLRARRARGELAGITGIDDPYEAPAAPEVEVGAGAVDDAVAAIVAELERLGVILVDG